MEPDRSTAVDGGLAREWLSRAVASDLEAIFKDAAATNVTGGRSPHVQTFVADSRRSGMSLTTIGAVVAAGLAGLSVGLALVRPSGLPEPALSSASAAHAGAPAVVAGPSAPKVAPVPAELLAPAATSTEQPAPKAKARPARDTSSPARSRAARAAQPAPAPQPRASGCGRLSGEAQARCVYAAVMEADRQLREAYVRAGRAGVDRPLLSAYRKRWDGLRRHAVQDPDAVVSGYRAMAGELDRLAHDRQAARTAERRRSGASLS